MRGGAVASSQRTSLLGRSERAAQNPYSIVPEDPLRQPLLRVSGRYALDRELQGGSPWRIWFPCGFWGGGLWLSTVTGERVLCKRRFLRREFLGRDRQPRKLIDGSLKDPRRPASSLLLRSPTLSAARSSRRALRSRQYGPLWTILNVPRRYQLLQQEDRVGRGTLSTVVQNTTFGSMDQCCSGRNHCYCYCYRVGNPHG